MAWPQDLQLQRGQRIQGVVNDLVSAEAVIVSYQGKLFRIRNTTQRKLAVGDLLDLEVVGLEPLEFRFYYLALSRINKVI